MHGGGEERAVAAELIAQMPRRIGGGDACGAATLGPNSAIEAGACSRTKVSMKPSKPHSPENRAEAAVAARVLKSAMTSASAATLR